MGQGAIVGGVIAAAYFAPGAVRAFAARYPGLFLGGVAALDETAVIGAGLAGVAGQQLSKGQRLGLIQDILGKLNPKNADEALGQLGRVMDKVEDTCSGVAKNPNPGLHPDGRMYPPKADNVFPQPDGSIIFQTRGHRGTISPDGKITWNLR